MTEKLKVCRLCLKSKVLKKIQDDLCIKIMSCIDIKLKQDDGLPSFICKLCEKRINKFYNFKEKCLEVDFKLRSLSKNLIYETTADIIKVEYDFNNTFDSWLGVETKTEFNKKEITEVKNEINNLYLEQNPENRDKCKISDEGRNQPTDEQGISGVKEHNLFQCELCGNFFKSKSVLENHILSHTGVKSFSCKLCPKRFSRAEHKLVHMRAHMGIKPYICEICGKSSTKRQDLIRHLLIHSDEKKFKCPRCDRRFKRSSDVHAHMRTHTGARPYKCTDCDKCYTSHSGLRKHHKTNCKSIRKSGEGSQ